MNKIPNLLIANLDLVVPAAILHEYNTIRCLKSYKENSKRYLETMTISPDYIMAYAVRMKKLDFGRVIINFGKDDVIYYINSNPNIFERIENSQVYKILLPGDERRLASERVNELINDFVLKINYEPYVLRTLGLWK